MTNDQLNELLANASDATRQLNLPVGGAGTVAKLERDPEPPTLGAVQGKAVDSRPFLVLVEAVHSRLIDEDNLCEKYHVDLLRYAGVIPDDAPDTTKIEVTQRKAKKGETEKVTITVYALDDQQTANVT